ncbi:MAG: 3-oxoacyl-ACP synthase III [bacterium]|nr:3-oxoacyl-ACP synthase III [bacterium]
MLHKDVYLQSLVYELPQEVVTTDSIYERLGPTFKRLGIPESWISSLSGVSERRVWPVGEKLSDIAIRIARKALEKSGFKPEDIGCVICTSVSKEFIEPSMACMVHNALNLPETTISYDIANACLAFINGISYMGQLIDQGLIKAALVVDVESSRRVMENTVKNLAQDHIDLTDFSKRFAGLTLGSGACAAVVCNSELASEKHKVMGHVTLADTRYCHHCIGSFTDIITDQTSLMKAGIELAKRTWDLAAKTLADWKPELIDQYICHQVGARHSRLLFETLGIENKKSFQTFPFLGNMGPASAPITLAMAAEKGVIKALSRVAVLGIGSGLNCSMMEIVW